MEKTVHPDIKFIVEIGNPENASYTGFIIIPPPIPLIAPVVVANKDTIRLNKFVIIFPFLYFYFSFLYYITFLFFINYLFSIFNFLCMKKGNKILFTLLPFFLTYLYNHFYLYLKLFHTLLYLLYILSLSQAFQLI